MGGPRDYHPRRSKPEKDENHTALTWGKLKNDANELIYKTQTDSRT